MLTQKVTEHWLHRWMDYMKRPHDGHAFETDRHAVTKIITNILISRSTQEDHGTLTSSLSELYETPTEWPKYVPTAPVVCTIYAGAHDAKLDIQCFKNCQHIRTCRKKCPPRVARPELFVFRVFVSKHFGNSEIGKIRWSPRKLHQVGSRKCRRTRISIVIIIIIISQKPLC